MPTVSIRIPQIGEGLQEARLVAVLKQPGDRVRRDEPIYQMETDKAVMDVESPYEGVLTEWLAQPDDVLAIGAEVARMEIAEAVLEGYEEPIESEPEAAGAAPAPEAKGAAMRNAAIPPRTRAYAKENGVGDEELAALAAGKPKLMPADIDLFLASRAQEPAAGYRERPLPPKQRLLSSRLVRAAHLAVPGTISVVANWEPIEAARARSRAAGGDFQPSTFTMFAYAVTKALVDHPAFRTSLVGEDTLRTYERVALGIAVGLPEDELVLAVVEEADTLSWREFAQRTRERIELARTGRDQATEAVTISLTNMQAFGLRDAVPVVVPPSVATLFLGEVYNALDPHPEEAKIRRSCNLALTFDHRLINGVGAANFLNAVKHHVETISSLL